MTSERRNKISQGLEARRRRQELATEEMFEEVIRQIMSDHSREATLEFWDLLQRPTEALRLFVGALCNQDSPDPILDYSSLLLDHAHLPLLLTKQLTEGEAAHRLSFIVQDKQLAKALRPLLEDKGPSVFPSIKALPPKTTFGRLSACRDLGFGDLTTKRLMALAAKSFSNLCHTYQGKARSIG
jgi:hypothetical protein